MIEGLVDTLEPYISSTCYSIEPFSDVAVALQVVQRIAERLTALLVEYPGVSLVDVVAVDFHEILDAGVLGELLLRQPAHLEEVGAEPDLLDVGLVVILRSNLLYRELLLGLFVLSQPNQRKAASAKQLQLLKGLRKAISKCLDFFAAQVERVGGLLILIRFPSLEDDVQLISGLPHLRLYASSLIFELLNPPCCTLVVALNPYSSS